MVGDDHVCDAVVTDQDPGSGSANLTSGTQRQNSHDDRPSELIVMTLNQGGRRSNAESDR
jgi:hypothetical protein